MNASKLFARASLVDFTRTETEKWGRLVKEANIRAD